MIITILDQSISYPNDISSIESSLNKIEEILKGNEVYLELMEIDGVEVFEGFQEYMIEHIQEIQEVNVKVQTLKQLLDESVLTMQQYLEGALPEVTKLADEFYQGATKESWDKLTQLFEGLSWVTQNIEVIQTKNQYHNSTAYIDISKSLQEELSNLEDALKNGDLVLTGDILKYEIVSILNQLLVTVITTIDNEVLRHDLS